MTINYIGAFKADITFDDDMTYQGLNDSYHPLDVYVNTATYLMETYGFAQAQIVDCKTGETLVKMESDCNDCGGPA